MAGHPRQRPPHLQGSLAVLLIALMVSIGITAYHNIHSYPWILDDAFISFRYAENFAAGHGLVFNASERVEGYTSFLWVFLLGIGKASGLDLPLLSRVLGSVFSLGCLLLTAFSYRLARVIGRHDATVAVLLLGTCGVFTPWAFSGMEVTLFVFLVILELLLYLSVRRDAPDKRRLLLTGLVGGLAALARPEGVLVFAVICLDLAIADLRRHRLTLHLALGAFLLVYAPYFIWRFTYYGYLLPNTFYAKVGSRFDQVKSGAAYTLRFLVPVAAVVVTAFLGVLNRRYRQRLKDFRVLLILVIVYCLYVIGVGGDCMPAYRFFVPLVPILALLASLSLTSLFKQQWLVWLVALLVAGYGVYQMHADYDIADLIRRDRIAWRGREVGLWLKQNASPDAVIATNTAGSVPYYSGLKAIDMLGMNDGHIGHRRIESLGTGFVGHEKGDGAYVLSRRPDYIIFSSAAGAREPAFLSDRELYDLPAFHQLYELVAYRLPSGQVLSLYRLK